MGPAFDPEEFFRRHATNPTATLTIKGYGTITLHGFVEGSSIAAHLAAQEPTSKVLRALAAFVGSQTPTASLLADLSQLLSSLPHTDKLLSALAELVAKDNPQVYSLVDGQRGTKSTLKILASLVARLQPCERTLREITDVVADQSPSSELLRNLAKTVEPENM